MLQLVFIADSRDQILSFVQIQGEGYRDGDKINLVFDSGFQDRFWGHISAQVACIPAIKFHDVCDHSEADLVQFSAYTSADHAVMFAFGRKHAWIELSNRQLS